MPLSSHFLCIYFQKIWNWVGLLIATLSHYNLNWCRPIEIPVCCGYWVTEQISPLCRCTLPSVPPEATGDRRVPYPSAHARPAESRGHLSHFRWVLGRRWCCSVPAAKKVNVWVFTRHHSKTDRHVILSNDLAHLSTFIGRNLTALGAVLDSSSLDSNWLMRAKDRLLRGPLLWIFSSIPS